MGLSLSTLFNKRFPKPNWSTTAYALIWVSFLAALLLVYASAAIGRIDWPLITNSDTLYFPALVSDLRASGRLVAWDSPPNPYIFPDLFLYLTSAALVDNVRVALTLVGLIQVSLFVLGWTLLQRQIFGFSREMHGLLLLTSIIYLRVLANGNSLVLMFSLLIVTHFGMLLVAPYALTLIAAVLRPRIKLRQRRLPVLLLAMLSLVTAFSDSLYSVYFVAPVVLSLLLVVVLDRNLWRNVVAVSASVVGAAVVGHALRNLLPSDSDLDLYVHFDAEKIPPALETLASVLLASARDNPALAVFWLCSFTALLISFVVSARRTLHGRTRQQLTILFVDTLLPLMALVAVAATTITGNFENIFQARYLMPILVSPLIVGIPFLANHFDRAINILKSRNSQFAMATIAVLLVAPRFVSQSWLPWPSPAHFTDPFVDCLDRETETRNLDTGLAQYWQAIYTSQLSNRDLKVVQVTSGLTPYHWNNSIDWYRDYFEFVIVEKESLPGIGIDAEQVTELFGAPAEIFECPGSWIYVYNRPDDFAAQSYIRYHLELASFENVGDEFEFAGAFLPANRGNVVGLSRVASDMSGDKAGIFTYGPYADLPAGDYYFELHTYANATATGAWDIALTEEDGLNIVDGGEIDAIKTNIISGFFSAPDRAATEIRVFYNGHDTLFVDRIRLKRVANRAEIPAFTTDTAEMTASRLDASSLKLIFPQDGANISTNSADFGWKWNGPSLAANQAFEIRLWLQDDPHHYGAHDVQEKNALVRQVGDTYTARLNLSGAYSFIQHGPGEYNWSVAIVEIKPGYRDLGIEADPSRALLIE